MHLCSTAITEIAVYAATFVPSHRSSTHTHHARNVVAIRRSKLAAIYFPADGGEDGDRRNKHWSGTDPDGDAQSYGQEAEVPVAIKDVIRNSTHCCGAFSRHSAAQESGFGRREQKFLARVVLVSHRSASYG